MHCLGIYAGCSHLQFSGEEVKAGFGQKTFTILEHNSKGNFSYQIKLDGKKMIFQTPSPNEEIKRYEEDTYLELEEFDQALMSLGIPKKSSTKGVEHCDLDRVYVERFLRIIKNK